MFIHAKHCQNEQFLGFFRTKLTFYALNYLRFMLFCFLKNEFHAANQNENFFHSYSQNLKDISNRCHFSNNHFVA